MASTLPALVSTTCYEVIPREAALKIQERDPRRIVQLNVLVESKTPEEDDPYAAYQIPDDLMW